MSIQSKIIDALWYGQNPFSGFQTQDHPADHQGWNSNHRYLTEAIDRVLSEVIIEVGVWKGGSVCTMAQHLKDRQIDAAIIAIDTWLGSSEHWLTPHEFADLRMKNGSSHLYHTFASNVFDRALQEYVVPLPLDSINAAHVINARGICPDVVHIDAGHDYQSATSDLTLWWHILKPGGILVGDDYFTDGKTWIGVRQAFDDFFALNAHAGFDHSDGKCIVQKRA